MAEGYEIIQGLQTVFISHASWKINVDRPTLLMAFYEGAGEAQTYDLPTDHCIVLCLLNSRERGIAIAVQWATGSSNKSMYINRLWSSWTGWAQVG